MIFMTHEQDRQLRLKLMMILQMAPAYIGKVGSEESSQLRAMVSGIQGYVNRNGNSMDSIVALFREGESRFPQNGLIVSLGQVFAQFLKEGHQEQPTGDPVSEPIPV
jgi:hypothetical protein